MTMIKKLLGDTFVGSSRFVILGIGSVLMSDDAAGVRITDALIERLGTHRLECFCIFSGGNAPENFTGAIKAYSPDHVLIIDAADFGGLPGELCIIDPAAVSGVSFSTHMLPLPVMLNYLHKEIGCRTTILGIQPSCLEFCSNMSQEVRKAVDGLIECLYAFILSNLKCPPSGT